MVHSTEQGLKLQFLVAALIAALVFLHYLLWLDENGVRQTHTLRIGVRAQTEENAELAERNRALAAEVEDLKRGLMAIEEQARSDMGMIRRDETFYRLLEKPTSSSAMPKKFVPSVKPGAPAQKPPASATATLRPPPAKPAPPAKPPAQPAKPAPLAKPVPPAKPPVQPAKPVPPAKPVSPAKPTLAPGTPQRRE